jgi:hypothetical protein
MHRRRRWAAVAVALAALLSVPAVVGALPADDVDVSPAELLRRVRASGDVAHEGYVEATSRLLFPDVPRFGNVVELLGETSSLRVWWHAPDRWRVDELTPVGERDTIQLGGLTWLWDSMEREATRVTGEPQVRLVRASDLLPTELGRRLAGSADDGGARLSPLAARRVAGRTAAGLRLTPTVPEDTTVARVDLWADPTTGLPLEVRVFGDGVAAAVVETRFLDLALKAPGAGVVTFTPPPGADVDFTIATDIAAFLDQRSIFVVPDEIARQPRRTRIASGGGTYGTGFALVGVVTLGDADYFRIRRRVSETLAPTESGAFGDGFVIGTPLLNGMVVRPPSDLGVAYVLAGSVPPDLLRRYATSLARTDPELRG